MTPKELTKQALELLEYLDEKKIPIGTVEFAISMYWHSQANKNT